MKTKLLTLLTLLLTCVTGAWASTVSDLTAITSDYTFIADNVTSNGTVALTNGTLYDSNRILSVGGNTNANNKGSVTFGGASHLNSLRLKGDQNQLAFKVAGACTITFYQQSHSTRNLQAGTSSYSKNLGSGGTSTTSWTLDLSSLTEPTVIYLSSIDPDASDPKKADMYLAGFEVTFPSSKVKTPSVSLGAWDAVNSKYAVTLNCATAASTIKYSTDNKANYSTYESALALSPGTKLDAYATADGMTQSDDMAQYTVPAAPCTISFAKGEGDGIVPSDIANIIPGTEITLPKNYTLFKNGYTLTKWNDGTENYDPGDKYTVTEGKTLTAQYTSNGGTTVYDRTTALTIKWVLGQSAGVPDFTVQGEETFVVAQATVAGKTIDVKLPIDATDGKIHPQTNEWGQANKGTKFTIPSANGAVITYRVYNNDVEPATTTVEEIDVDVDGDTYEFSVSKDNQFYEYFQVELPKPDGAIEDLVFNYSAGDANVNSWTKTPITVATTSSGIDGGNKFLKPHDGDYTITISGANALITNVVFNFYSNSYVSNAITADDETTATISGSTATWTPTAEKQSVTFTVDNDNSHKGRITSIVVSYVDAEAVSTLAGRNYGSYVTSSKLDFTNVTDAKAYVATGLNDGKDAVVLTQVYKVPANEPLIIYTTEKESAATVYVPKTPDSADDAVASNNLVAGDGKTAWDGTANTTYYYLAGDLFHEATSGTLQSGKAYLAVTSGPGARELSIVFDEGETTAIDAMHNSQCIMHNEFFDLQGRRIAQPTKGLYIVNGRKVIIK